MQRQVGQFTSARRRGQQGLMSNTVSTVMLLRFSLLVDRDLIN
jgi:hypothetical protein